MVGVARVQSSDVMGRRWRVVQEQIYILYH